MDRKDKPPGDVFKEYELQKAENNILLEKEVSNEIVKKVSKLDLPGLIDMPRDGDFALTVLALRRFHELRNETPKTAASSTSLIDRAVATSSSREFKNEKKLRKMLFYVNNRPGPLSKFWAVESFEKLLQLGTKAGFFKEVNNQLVVDETSAIGQIFREYE